MREMKPTLKAYFTVIGSAGLIVAASQWYNSRPESLGWVLLFALAIAAADKLAVIFPSGYSVTIGASVALAAMWLHGPSNGVLSQLLGGLMSAIADRRTWLASLFNIGMRVLATWAAGLVFRILVPGVPGLITPESVQGAFITFLVMMLVNNLIMTRAMSIHKGTSWVLELAGVFDSVPVYLVINFVAASVIATTMKLVGPAGLALTLLLLAAHRYGMKFLSAVSQERALDKLIRMANRPDSPRREHVHEVLKYSNTLAEELGLPFDQARLVGYAALLHEIGLSPELERRLQTPGRLTAEEQREVQEAGVRGAEIISRLGALDQVAVLVRHQGEWHDGSGFPDGLKGDQIPVGAQIIALADAFQALVSSRPYRSAKSLKEAAQEIRSLAGKRFAPPVVDAFDKVVARETWPLPGGKSAPDRLEEMAGDSIEQLRQYVERRNPGDAFSSRRVSPWGCRLSSFLVDLSPEVVALGNLTHVLNSTVSLEETLRLAARTISQLVGAKTLVLLSDRGDSRLTVRAAYGLSRDDLVGRRVPRSHYPAPKGMDEGKPVIIHDLSTSNGGLDKLLVSLEGCRSGAYVPLVCRGRNLGVIVVYWAKPHRHQPREMGLLSLVAGQAALAIENARLLSEAEERLERLAEMKRFTDFLLENVPAGITVIDAAGRLTLANATAKEHYKRMGCELIAEGEPYLDFINHLGFSNSPIERALKTGLPVADVNIQAGGSQGTLILQLFASPLKDNHGNTIGALSVGWDVTRLRQMEEQVRRVEKMAAVGELAAGAAHEIRNPLTSVRGFMQLLQLRASGRNMEQEYFDIVISELDRIESIVRDMMVLARPAKPRLAECDLHQLLDEILLLSEGVFSGASVEVFRAYCSTGSLVSVDRAMIRQVLLNLIQNAVQAMPGGGRLTISTERSEESFIVSVTDTGVGIAAEDIPKLFIPFFTTKENGTGLGLAVSYGVVQAHGGKINVESRVGVGTTFSVVLPLRSVSEGRSFAAGDVL